MMSPQPPRTAGLRLAALPCLLGALALTSCSKQKGAFEHADANQDGKLQASEVEVVLSEAIFFAGDESGDGVVVYQEWLKVFPKASKDKFEAADTDGAAGLTLEEATKALSKDDVFDKLIAKIDTNGDGVIDKEEAGAFYDAFQAAEGDNDIQKLDAFLNS